MKVTISQEKKNLNFIAGGLGFILFGLFIFINMFRIPIETTFDIPFGFVFYVVMVVAFFSVALISIGILLLSDNETITVKHQIDIDNKKLKEMMKSDN